MSSFIGRIMESTFRQHTGFASKEAMQKLCDVIEEEVNSYETELERNGTVLSLIGQRASLRLHADVVFSWISALSLLSCGFLLLVASAILPDVYTLIEAAFLILFCALNLYLSGWNFHLKQRELIDQSRSLLKDMKDVISSGGEWSAEDYLPLHSPQSSSISLQWTYRDGELVNLPQALLVEGDIIVVRPGRPVPGGACNVQDSQMTLTAGEVFLPKVEGTVTDAAVRVPLQPEKFVMLETPYRRFLNECLQKGNHRPVTLLENRRLMGCHFIERVIIPLILIASLLVNIIRFTVAPEDSGHWAEMLIVLQVNVILPLCPLAFPLMWIVLNHYGIGRLVALFHSSRLLRFDQSGETLAFSEENNTMDKKPRVTWGQIFRHSISSFLGRSCHLPRTASLLHGLGTVTSFSCVDKQGILSYPDPNIEKVFFIGNGQETSDNYGSKNSLISEDSQLGRASDWPLNTDQEDHFPQTQAEVLTVSINADSPTGLQFDEHDWEKHLKSLKPMGLNILLNACHSETVSNYFQFLDHVHAVTTSRLKHRAPLSAQRRCLCQGAYLMGFTEKATDQYLVEQQIAMYKAVPADRKLSAGGSLRSQSLVQRKNPVPQVLSVIARDQSSDDYQVMTQGTAHLVLSLCTDFWDGQDLQPLNESDRKKIFDFYQRAMLSSYCSVLAYQPVVDFLPEQQGNLYIELPSTYSKHGHIHKQPESPSMVRSSWDVNSCKSLPVDGVNHPKARNCRSLDSAIDSIGRLPVGEECLRAMNGQIFIGMIALNFQPKTDILTLIEQLDHACIRFVHFSEDQVLRSKVFAEKMGLEAGWNCHISLQSEHGEVRSLSHGNSGQMSNHPSQASSAGIEQIELDVDGQRVRFKEDSQGNVHEDVEMGNEQSEDLTVEEVIKQDVNIIDESGGHQTSETEALLIDEISVDVGKEIDELEQKKVKHKFKEDDGCHDDDEDFPPEWRPLLEDDPEHSYLQSNFSNRHRQISETHTCSDGTDVDTTDSVTGFDVSNRARLPRGIENIRPHIQGIDNVPLQVPLFTDVTPETTREMIQIMQENNEVVCCLGSSVNITNMPIFAQADFSIGLEPMYPHICLQEDGSREEVKSINRDYLPPMELTAILTSLPCSVYFHRSDHISITAILQEARVLCQGITNCFTFFLFAILTISAINFVSSLFLPPPLSGRHILWLSVFVAPGLSLSLVGTPGGSEVMRWSTGKNTYEADRKNMLLLCCCFIAKFGGIIVVTLSCHVHTLNSLCIRQNSTSHCHLIYGDRDLISSWNGLMAESASHLALAQNLNMFLITLNLVLVSSSFVHPLVSLWRHTPVTNGLWCLISLVIMVLAIFLLLVVTPLFLEAREPPVQLGDIHISVWILGCLWPLPNLVICEAVKVLEIREYVQWQRRSKLLFDTKLGMNSPF